MLLVDDIVMLPARGLLWVFRTIDQAVQEERASEAEHLKLELGDLYMMLESGAISEHEYDQREQALLDRLENLRSERE